MSEISGFSMGGLLKKVEKTIGEFNMFMPGDSVLVGLSGGADSVALMYILLDLKDMLSINVDAAHLNHCLRGDESDRDEAFAARLAKQLGVGFYTERADVRGFQALNRLSLETAARQMRYDFFERIVLQNGYDKIAVAHHSDDNAELILMNILRGSGPAGLSGIPPVRDGKVVRPLISVTREEIMGYLNLKKISHVTDSTNFEANCLRNKIRLNLMPLLKNDFNSSITDILTRTGGILRDENSWMDRQVSLHFKEAVVRKEPCMIEFSVDLLRKADPAVARRMARMAIEHVKGDLMRITLGHVEALLSLADKRAGALQDLPGQIRAERKDDGLMISRQAAPLRSLGRSRKADAADIFCLVDRPDGRVVDVTELGLKMRFSCMDISGVPVQELGNSHIAYMDMDLVKWPVHIRTRREGDRFNPIGMKGSQKLKKFFINSRVPREKRSSWPIVADRERIIWVAGLRMGESVKIGESTVNVLKMELLLA